MLSDRTAIMSGGGIELVALKAIKLVDRQYCPFRSYLHVYCSCYQRHYLDHWSILATDELDQSYSILRCILEFTHLNIAYKVFSELLWQQFYFWCDNLISTSFLEDSKSIWSQHAGEPDFWSELPDVQTWLQQVRIHKYRKECWNVILTGLLWWLSYPSKWWT